MKTEKEKSPERFAAFDSSPFKPGENVIYRQEGKWRKGILTGEPKVSDDKNSVTLTIQKGLVLPEGEFTVESKTTPRQVLFKELESINYQGISCEVELVQAGPDGEVWYDLKAADGTVKSRVDQRDIVADQKSVRIKEKIGGLVDRTEKKTSKLIEKIKAMKDKARYEYLTRIQKIQNDLAIFKSRSKMSNVNLEALDTLSNQIDDLQSSVEEEISELSAKLESKFDIGAGLEHAQRTSKDLNTRAEATGDASLLVKAAKILAKVNDLEPADPLFDEALVSVFKDMGALDVALTEFEMTAAFDAPEELKKLKKTCEALRARLKNADPGSLKKLDKISVKVDRLDEADPKIKDAITGLLEEMHTVETAVIENAFKEEAKTKFDAEEGIEKVRKAYDVLRNRVIKLNDRELSSFIDAVSAKIKSLKPTAPNIKEALIDALRDVHNADIAVTEHEFKKKLKVETKSKEKKVLDIPAPIMTTIFSLHTKESKKLFEKVFTDIAEGRDEEGAIAGELKQFFTTVLESLGKKETAYLLEQLKEHHIYVDDLRGRLDDGVFKNMAKSLRHAAEQQVTYWASQKLFHLRGETGLPGNMEEAAVRFREWKQTSPFANMGGVLTGKLIAHTVVLGGVGWLANTVISHIPFLSENQRGAAVGSVVGVARTGLHQIIGGMKGVQEAEAHAAEKGMHAKKHLIKDYLLDQTFDESGTDVAFRKDKDSEWGRLFATMLRRSTQENKKEEVLTAGEVLTLKGDEILTYHQTMYRAEHDAGLEPEKLRFRFIKAAHGLRYNGKISEKERLLAARPSFLHSKIKWVSDLLSGRLSKPKPFDGRIQDGKITVPAIAGAIAGYAIADRGNNWLRAGIGAAYGFQRGYLSRTEEETGEADMEARKQVKKVLGVIENFIIKKPEDVTLTETQQVREYHDLLVVMLRGQDTELSIKNIDFSTLQYFQHYQKDIAGVLDRDVMLRTEVESILFEINRSGLLERQGFSRALDALEKVGIHREEMVENSWGVQFRGLKRWVRGTLYGLVGGAVSWGLGRAADHLRAPSYDSAEVATLAEPEPSIVAAAEENTSAASVSYNTGHTAATPAPETGAGTSSASPDVVLDAAPVVPKLDLRGFLAETQEYKFGLVDAVDADKIDRYAREWAAAYPDYLGDNFVRQEFKDWVLVDKALNPSVPPPHLSGYEIASPAQEIATSSSSVAPTHNTITSSEIPKQMFEPSLSDHHPLVIKPSGWGSETFSVDYFDPSSPEDPFSFKLLAKYQPSLDADGYHVTILKGGERVTGLLETAWVEGGKVPVFKMQLDNGTSHTFTIDESGKFDGVAQGSRKISLSQMMN